MKQRQSLRSASPATARPLPRQPGTLPLDALRLEQFLDFQRTLLADGGDVAVVAARVVQGVARLIDVRGVAVGVLDEGHYRVLDSQGLDDVYRARYHGSTLRDSPLARALTAQEPVLVLEPTAAGEALRTLALPFTGVGIAGALHLVVTADTVPPPEDLALARALTLVAAGALIPARQCERLARAARLKSDALAGMAHDLRAPLNALVGYTSLLNEEAFGPLAAEQREVTTILERQALELVDLLDATLDVARLETAQLPVRIEEFTLTDVLASLRAATFAHASRGGRLVTAVPSDLPPLHSDRIKVKEILQNLLDNALKHSGGGAVTIDASLAPDRETMRLTVRDTGPGIAADVLPYLFEPFRPGHGRSQGSGYGLYLVRCFSEALGGRVAARSIPGEGTAVTVEIPLSAPRR